MTMLTEETPGKVVGLLGSALASMAFLFMVTISNASFQGAQVTVPDPFAPQNVVAVLDTVSKGYSNFLDANLFKPAAQEVAFVQDNVNWVIDNSDQQIVASLGLNALVTAQSSQANAVAPKVAGAFTSTASSQNYLASSDLGVNIDSLYRLLIR